MQIRGGARRRLAAAIFFGGVRRQRQGVDALAHLVGKQTVDQALTLDPRLAGEGVGDDQQPEMRFAPLAGAGVARVLMGFVNDFEPLGSEGGGEFIAQCLGNAHDAAKVGRGRARVKPAADWPGAQTFAKTLTFGG